MKQSWKDFFRRYANVLAILILVVMLCLEIFSAAQESQTMDEAAHLLAGYQYWQDHEIVLNPEHPPLIKLMASFPLLFMDISYPWPDPEKIEQWPDSDAFMYAFVNDADAMLFWGRLPVMLLSLLLGWFVFKWARDLGGDGWGIFALVLYAFDPNIIAHSRYITTDIGVTCFLLMAMYFYWRFLFREKFKDLVLLSLSLGAAIIAKFSALVFGPAMVLILAGVKHLKRNINYAYLFLVGGSIVAAMVLAAYFLHPIPYLEGFKMVQEHSEWGHDSYLLGENRSTGWWYYFPLAFALKTPAITMAFLFLAVLYFLFFAVSSCKKGNFKKNKKDLQNFLFLLIPTASYFAISMTSHLNLGVRHLLPAYPLLIIFIAFAFSKMADMVDMKALKRSLCWLLAAAVAAYIASGLAVYPDYLSFFGVFAGGSDRGIRYLHDSNIDWGQDLKKAAAYLEEKGIDEDIYFNYYGRAYPSYYGIENYDEWDGRRRDRLILISRTYIAGKDPSFRYLLNIEPQDVIGGSIEVYDFR